MKRGTCAEDDEDEDGRGRFDGGSSEGESRRAADVAVRERDTGTDDEDSSSTMVDMDECLDLKTDKVPTRGRQRTTRPISPQSITTRNRST